MPETNPKSADATKPAKEAATTPDNGSAPASSEQSNAAASQESQPTPEQIAEWRRAADQYRALEPEYRKVTQQNSYIQQEAERLRQIAETALGRQQQAVDPEAAVNAEFAEALQSFDPKRIMEATAKRDAILAQKMQAQLLPQVAQLLRVNEGLRGAQEWGYGDPNKLREVQQSLTPEELAKIAAMREGKYDTIVEERKKRAKEEAERASIIGSNMNGRANGMQPRHDPKDPHPNPVTFFAWHPKRRDEHVKKHGVPPYARRVE